MQPLPFQGFKHGELARRVHENPTMWHATLFGMSVGKPPEEEDLCREVLLELGYTLAEIRNLHHCKFNITAYFELTRGSPEEKTSTAASSTLPSSSPSQAPRPPTSDTVSIPMGSPEGSPHLRTERSSSLLSYMPESPLLRRSSANKGSGTPPTEQKLSQSDSFLVHHATAADPLRRTTSLMGTDTTSSATAMRVTDAPVPPPVTTHFSTSSDKRNDLDDHSVDPDQIPEGGLFAFDEDL